MPRTLPAVGTGRTAAELGVQTVAPSSINASLNTPGLRATPTNFPARSHAQSDCSAAVPRLAETRIRTRATFPSTSGSAFPNTIDEIAPAVYRPTPGSRAESHTACGTTPPKSATIAFAAPCRSRARR